jgi:hypothetical protein
MENINRFHVIIVEFESKTSYLNEEYPTSLQLSNSDKGIATNSITEHFVYFH